MTTAIIYVFPIPNQQIYEPLARRFCSSYMRFPPGERDHTIHVYANGAPLNDNGKRLFSPLPCEFHSHTNHGKDIGAFQKAAEEIPCDLLVCLGANIHFRRAGWLDRIIQVYEQNGPALYGCWAFHQPKPHIRTTAFWLPPEILDSYPDYVGNDQRYEFEFGDKSMVAHTKRIGFESYMVTWNGVYAQSEWQHVPNEDCLMLDQHAERIGYT